MPPRSEEPRRDATGSRRGSSRNGGGRGGEPRSGEPGVGGISDARAYTPRGRTVREQRAGGRAERDADAGPAEQRRTVDGRVAHSTLLEVFTSEGFGTMV
ncbi:hypothetical protein AB0B83_24675, partial [Micromonospora sp. NPDC049060]